MIRVMLVDDQALVRSGFRVILDTQPDIEVVGEAVDGAEAVRMAAELQPDVICIDIEMPVMNGIEAARAILAPDSVPAPGTESDNTSAQTQAPPQTQPSSSTKPQAQVPSVLVLTTFGHEQYLFDAIAAGVSGFLLKTSRAEQLIDAVRTLAGGGALLGPDVTRAVMERAAAAVRAAGSSASPEVPDATRSGVPHAMPEPHATVETHPEPTAVSSTASASGAEDDAATPDEITSPAAIARVGLTEREREVLGLVAAGLSNGEIASQLFVGEATVKTHVSNLLQKVGVRDRVQLVVWAHTAE